MSPPINRFATPKGPDPIPLSSSFALAPAAARSYIGPGDPIIPFALSRDRGPVMRRASLRAKVGVPVVALWALAVAAPARGDLPIEQEPIRYSAATADDPVARLQKKLDRG